jgi:DNA-directed RNA polymerase subunit RPC12/RpoP
MNRNDCIEKDDIVRTSYGTGPYEVWDIFGPRYTSRFVGVMFVYRFPYISLRLKEPGNPHSNDSIINTVRRFGDRWFTYSGDEIFIEKPVSRTPVQLTLFPSELPAEEPFEFQPGAQYEQEIMGYLWICAGCGAHFNTDERIRWGYPVCPHCGARYGVEALYLMPETGPHVNEYLLSIR